MEKEIIYVVMQYDSTKFNWSAYECFDKEIKAEMKASALNKNAQGYRERFSYKVVEFSPKNKYKIILD